MIYLVARPGYDHHCACRCTRHNGAKPSAGTALTIKLESSSPKFIYHQFHLFFMSFTMVDKILRNLIALQCFTHWGRVTHICVSKLTIIGSDNGLLPGLRQAIICTSDGILLIGPLWTNFSEILIKIHTFSLKKIHLEMSSGKWRLFCLGLIKAEWLYMCMKTSTLLVQIMSCHQFGHKPLSDPMRVYC